MTFVQSVIITSKPGNTDKILKYLTDIKTEAEEKEPGTLKFHAAQSLDDDNVIYLWEEYESEEALAAHRAGKAYQTFFAVRDDLMAHAVKIQRCRPL